MKYITTVGDCCNLLIHQNICNICSGSHNLQMNCLNIAQIVYIVLHTKCGSIIQLGITNIATETTVFEFK